jgi:GT2 family glycosyltransferase
MTTTPSVSVIIVTFNGKRHLGPCLDSVANQSLPRTALEILVVDNASADGSDEFARAVCPQATVLRLPANLGFAGGCNAGIRATRGEFIALLNDDAVAHPKWLEQMLRAAKASAQIGGVAGKIRFLHEPEVLNSAGLNLSWNGYGEDRGFREPDRGQYDAPAEVFGACGASVLLRRAMLDDIGLLDESLFMYYEDLDLAWRARLRGWRFIYEPTAWVSHIHCATSGERTPFFCFHDERNRVLVNVKNNTAVTAVYALLGFLVHAGRAWRDVLRGRRGMDHGLAYVRAAASLARRLPRALTERYRIRHVRRLVGDLEVSRLVTRKNKVRPTGLRACA